MLGVRTAAALPDLRVLGRGRAGRGLRLFLDAHLSGRAVAAALGAEGHDVCAVDEERTLDGASDEDLLALAASERRIVVTQDVADFPGIAQRWAGAGRAHTGLIVLLGIDHSEFGVITRSVGRELKRRSRQADWADVTIFAGRR